VLRRRVLNLGLTGTTDMYMEDSIGFPGGRAGKVSLLNLKAKAGKGNEND